METFNLEYLKIEHLKGVDFFEVILEGRDAEIRAENRKGKTTVADSIQWLLFGKNTKGESKFDLRPLDKDNNAIKGLIVAVEAGFKYKNKVHVFRREHHEKIVKKQVTGFETIFKIDEVPMLMKEYNEYISKIISEEKFRILSDLNYFNTMDWNDQRKILIEIVGEIAEPEGFEELNEDRDGRSIKAYKKVLIDRKKAHEKERKEINPRLDEVNKTLGEYVAIPKGEVDIEQQRKDIENDNFECDTERKLLTDTEQQRNELIEEKNTLVEKKIKREGVLKNDTSGIAELIEEKQKIEQGIGNLKGECTTIQTDIDTKDGYLRSKERTLGLLLEQLNEIRVDAKNLDDTEIDNKCPIYDITCLQIPEEKKAEAEAKRQEKLIQVLDDGKDTKEKIAAQKTKIAKEEKYIEEAKESLEKATILLKEAEDNKSDRFEIIERKIKANITTPPEKDFTWREIKKKIDDITAEIGDPVSEKIQLIDSLKTENAEKLVKLNDALKKADQAKEATERIKELEASEIDLAQKIADIEKQLKEIENFITAESKLLEVSVNKLFESVEFKLFDTLLTLEKDGDKMEPKQVQCCEAMLDGIPFKGMSTGEKIVTGVDIINVLSEFYGFSPVLFIDNAESLTLEIKPKSQTIKLFAEKGVKDLGVTID